MKSADHYGAQELPPSNAAPPDAAEIQSRAAEILSRTLEIGTVAPMPPRLLLTPRVEVPSPARDLARSRAISARSR